MVVMIILIDVVVMKVFEPLNSNSSLHHVDLSDNDVHSLGDIRGLTKLKVLFY